MNSSFEPTSEQIKLAILKWLKSQYNGDGKYNIIGRADAPVGAIETSLGGRFNADQRHLASKCFDELRTADLIRSTHGGGLHPEDWVKITNAGIEALEGANVDEPKTVANDIHLYRLKLLFIGADGSEQKAQVLTEVFKIDNLSEADAWKEADYMKGEGWIQILSDNGPPRVRLTHEGVKKAMDTPVFGSGHKQSSNTPAPQPVTKMTAPIDARNVFVVHGRNLDARNSLFRFLRSIGLRPLEWSQAIQMTGKASPFIGEILDVAFSQAQAVVVLMTPDDVAQLQEPFRSPHDPPYEAQLTGQARPNVLFEAGIAMGRNPERTVIVELGALRPFSDIAGRHTVRLSNDSVSRHELAQRLETAGCPIDLTGRDWHSEGDFDTGRKRNP